MLNIEHFQAARARQELRRSETYENRLSFREMESAETSRWQRIEQMLRKLLHRGMQMSSNVDLPYA